MAPRNMSSIAHACNTDDIKRKSVEESKARQELLAACIQVLKEPQQPGTK